MSEAMEAKHTPTPWTWKEHAGAGLGIYGPVELCEAVELPFPREGAPKQINIFGLTLPANIQLAYERWVQFEPKGWADMQRMNAAFIVRAANAHDAMVDACRFACSQAGKWPLDLETVTAYEKLLAALKLAESA